MAEKLSDEQARDELKQRDDALLYYLWRNIEALKSQPAPALPIGHDIIGTTRFQEEDGTVLFLDDDDIVRGVWPA